MLIGPAESLPQQLARREKHCDFETIHRFAVVSEDFNPIHIDREFASLSPMGGIIAHGPMSLGLLFECLNDSLVSCQPFEFTVDVYFRRPVRENDTIVASGHLLDDQPRTYAVSVKNQHGEVVVEGHVQVLNDARV